MLRPRSSDRLYQQPLLKIPPFNKIYTGETVSDANGNSETTFSNGDKVSITQYADPYDPVKTNTLSQVTTSEGNVEYRLLDDNCQPKPQFSAVNNGEDTTFAVTDDGKNLITTATHADGSVTETTLGDTGLPTKQVEISSDGSVKTTTEYEEDGRTPLREIVEDRDENGNSRMTTTNFENGMAKDSVEEVKDAFGNTLKETVTEYAADGETPTKETTTYEDGHYLNQAVKTVVKETLPDGTTVTTYYDADGNEITEHGSPVVA